MTMNNDMPSDAEPLQPKPIAEPLTSSRPPTALDGLQKRLTGWANKKYTESELLDYVRYNRDALIVELIEATGK